MIVKMSKYFPEEVIVRILERLPTKSLIRFTCLSKRWNYIILFDPQFARSQFQIASQSQTLTRRLLFKSPISEFHPKPESPFESLELEAPIENNSCLVRKVHTPFIQPRDIIHHRSCNGLLCVLYPTSIFIWNPTTGFYRELPCPEEVPEKRFVNCFGFGYVSAIDDYKVFAVTGQNEEKEEEDDYLHLILSLRAPNIWKKIEIEHLRSMRRFGTLFHEALHWCRVSTPEIFAFDLCKEDCRIMPIPIEVHMYCELGVSPGGCLCLLNPNNGVDSADFWVMRQYGDDDSWTKQYTFKLSTKNYYIRFFLPMETSVFVEIAAKCWAPMCNFKLISSRHSEDKVEICIVSNKFLDVVEYQETLLWLP